MFYSHLGGFSHHCEPFGLRWNDFSLSCHAWVGVINTIHRSAPFRAVLLAYGEEWTPLFLAFRTAVFAVLRCYLFISIQGGVPIMLSLPVCVTRNTAFLHHFIHQSTPLTILMDKGLLNFLSEVGSYLLSALYA